MEWEKFWTLFHKAWGQCHESQEYDKNVFNDMQGMLQNLEKEKKQGVVIQNRRKVNRRKEG